MEPAILLDTSVLIEFFRKRKKETATLFRLIDSYHFCISVITLFEIKAGIRSERQRRDVEQLLARIEVLPLDASSTEKAVEIYRDLRQRNALIGLADLLIAATAARYGLPIATLNKKHFERIPALQLVE